MAFTRIKYSKGRPYLYLVENYREGGKVRQRVLQYLGAVDIDAKVQEINRALETSEFEEKEMQKRADWNQEGKREWYEGEVKREQEEQKRLRQKLKVFKRHQKKLGTTFQSALKKKYDALYKNRQGKSMVTIPELWREMKKQGYSRKQFEKELLELQDKRVIDLQVHYSPTAKERREGIKTSSMEAPFYFVNWRGKKRLGTTKSKTTRKSSQLGTTFSSDLRYHFERLDRTRRMGNMVPIPTIYREMKENYSENEFRQKLLELEKKRVIDLQTASDPKLIAKRDRDGGFYLQDGKFYDYEDRPTGGTRRGYINYIVWRK